MKIPKISNPKYWENGIVCDIGVSDNTSKFNSELYKLDSEIYLSYLEKPLTEEEKEYYHNLGLKEGNKKTFLEFFAFWVMIGWVMAIITILISMLLC